MSKVYVVQSDKRENDTHIITVTPDRTFAYGKAFEYIKKYNIGETLTWETYEDFLDDVDSSKNWYHWVESFCSNYGIDLTPSIEEHELEGV